MTRWLTALVIAAILSGASLHNVVLINATSLKIVRIQIGEVKLEDVKGDNGKILVSVTPEKHDMVLTFRGGTRITWKDFDFAGVHTITFELVKNKILAHYE